MVSASKKIVPELNKGEKLNGEKYENGTARFNASLKSKRLLRLRPTP
jgi:hypothetical protein